MQEDYLKYVNGKIKEAEIELLNGGKTYTLEEVLKELSDSLRCN